MREPTADAERATRWLLDHAWLGEADGVRRGVLVEAVDGLVTRVDPAAPAEEVATAERVPGLTVPGFANAHSHAFHRALRGRTQTERGTFWTWREQMYDLARRLTPDSYHRLARAVFAEMVAAGWTSVGEFHYLHHDPTGTRYPEHAMEEALLVAAGEAGLRITLLDTAYLSSGFGAPPHGVQVRYSDGTVTAWEDRVAALAERISRYPHARLGVAVHSVRAVEGEQIAAIAAFAESRGLVLHAHVSEQRAENADCLARYGLTPTQVLAEYGALGPRTSLVHATHLTAEDIALIGAVEAFACFCATTERDLGDGIGPGRELAAAGARLTLGSDSHAVVDPFEEMRAVEMNERLAAQSRGHWSADELLLAGTRTGHQSLGWEDAGEIAVGQRADLVTLDLTTARTAGTGAAATTPVFAATSADVVRVVVDGRVVPSGTTGGGIGPDLAAAIDALGRET